MTCARVILMLLLVLCASPYGIKPAPVWADEPTEEEIGPVQVLQSEAAALHEIFDDIDSFQCDTVIVTDSLRAHLESTLHRGVRDSVYIVYEVFKDGFQSGLAIVTEEKGKYRPITFMAGISPALRVVDVRVLVYRESRGGQVQRSRFLRQYRGKKPGSPIRINRDIINITGATVSVHALNAGVRKCLAVAAIIAKTNSDEGESP